MNTASKAAIMTLGSIVFLISAVKFTAVAFPPPTPKKAAAGLLDYSSYKFSDHSKQTGRNQARGIHLEYTVGNDEMIISRFTTPDEAKLDDADKKPYTSLPRYIYWNDNGKSCFSISSKSNMSKEQVLEILKEAARK
ncbi:hypothetical protein [Paenibacillus sp.]|jgi:hypothetical protein|uniref:hypothetical protein n=1 Tax=Paenibacillus sp. TaxID=58172 RepID=UPI00282802C3|nr:hypothetical protein [Paenibacillus sp.]MDR0271175.1 hypothetical protein [Paenibacillus sp.]